MEQIAVEAVMNPNPEDLEVLDRGLGEFNITVLGERSILDYRKIAVFARNEQGVLVGGAYGELRWDWLHVKVVWIHQNFRHQGTGSKVLIQIELVALGFGFARSHLETTSFQALAFYQKCGYQIFGVLEGKPKGHNWYYLKKELGRSPTILSKP